MKVTCDIAIVGSGFAGSLLALMARQLGRSVVLVEKDRHPRFVIGESSTPLANLLLEELAHGYDLPQLLPFSKWGSWQRAHPEIACGLKRGFTFCHHALDATAKRTRSAENELLVAASPRDEIADTHWYRPDFDAFLVRQAEAAGVGYFDQTHLSTITLTETGAQLAGNRQGNELQVEARFVVDATGPRGFLHRALGLGEAPLTHLPKTEAIYTHFRGVRRWDELHGVSSGAEIPYPPDDAALHHVFPGGWIWVLRFNNGLTSAGAALHESLACELRASEGTPAWERLLERLPAVREQFHGATAARPFVHLPRMSFRSATVTDAGGRWALLPSAAGFLDPLLSTGFPLTLLGVERLARCFREAWDSKAMVPRLAAYERQTFLEFDATERLIGALYATMDDFPSFTALTLLYFAAASFSETVRRLGRPARAASFLLASDPRFSGGFEACCALARDRSPEARVRLRELVFETIAPFDVAGLCDSTRHPWYPAKVEDLFAAAPKLGVSAAEIQAMLARCGFAPCPHPP